MKTFEQFLQDVHGDEYHGLDDDMPDAFERFVCDLDAETWFEYGDEYGEYCAKFVANEANRLASNIN